MRLAVKPLLAVPFVTLIVTFSLSAAAAAPGSPDVSFGPAKDGIVTLGPDGRYLGAHAVAIQPDGHILVAGQVCSGVGQGCDIAVARLNPDGTLDTTFNNSGALPGLQTIDLGQEEHAESVQATVEGRIEVSGYTCNAAHTKCTFLLIRLLPDGQYDTTFGNGGIINPDYPSGDNDAEANAMALQPDGKMVMGGFAAPGGTDDFTLMRYYPNTVDLSFANGGIVTSDFAQRDDRINALALQPDGLIVAAGESCVAHSSACSFAVARFKTNGFLNDGSAGETPFGTAGGVTTDIQSGGDNRATAVTLQPDGKIIVVGQACTLSHSTCSFAVVRYTADGLLDTGDGQGDPGFNQGTGKAVVSIGTNDIPEAVVWQPDGKIVMAGYSYDSTTGSHNLALARLNADGTPDSGFGTDGTGTVVTDLGGGDYAYAMALQPDGKIVVVGMTATTNGAKIAVVRYIAQDPGWTLKPKTFSFTALHDVAPGSVQVSNSITVQGLADGAAVPVTVLNGSYDKNGSGTYTAALGWARNGDRFTVAQRASTLGGQSATAGLLIGGIASVTNPSLILGTPAPATFTVITAQAPLPGGGGGAAPLSCAALAVSAAVRRLRRARRGTAPAL